MEQFIEWYNLIFYLPLAIGLLFALGAGVDFGHDIPHGDVHADIHADADHDAEHDHDGEGTQNSILGFLGIGRVPLAISFMALFLIFAGTGLICNIVIGFLIKAWSGFALISIGVALIASFFGTAFVSRMVSRVMPTTETDSVTKHDLLGCAGTITLDCVGASSASPDGRVQKTNALGMAQITNSKGTMYQIRCVSDKPLLYGTKIITIDYDSKADCFTVDVDPIG
jgi:membrane protein implicated in regulation of membrane protease activity